jgi:hypothetical protein
MLLTLFAEQKNEKGENYETLNYVYFGCWIMQQFSDDSSCTGMCGK